jgi:hypothetical protein
VTAQELQQVRHLVSFTTTGLAANALVSTPPTALVPLDVHFAEISQHYAVLRKPTIECHRVPYFDVNDVRRVLLRSLAAPLVQSEAILARLSHP